MVDFNNENTVAQPPQNIVRILILQAWANVLEAWESYSSNKNSKGIQELNFIISRLQVLFLQVQAMLERKMPPEDYTLLKNRMLLDCTNLDENDVIDIICTMNKFLDQIQLTKIDTRKHYNRQSVEEENMAWGV